MPREIDGKLHWSEDEVYEMRQRHEYALNETHKSINRVNDQLEGHAKTNTELAIAIKLLEQTLKEQVITTIKTHDEVLYGNGTMGLLTRVKETETAIGNMKPSVEKVQKLEVRVGVIMAVGAFAGAMLKSWVDKMLFKGGV